MKKLLISIIMLLILVISLPSFKVRASSDSAHTTRIVIINGHTYYVETVITEGPHESISSLSGLTQTKTATKTDYYRDIDYNLLCTLSITATFIYDDITSQCVFCSEQAATYESHWSVKNSSSNHIGNSATANATFTQTLLFGMTHDYNTSVTIYCSPTGVIS